MEPSAHREPVNENVHVTDESHGRRLAGDVLRALVLPRRFSRRLSAGGAGDVLRALVGAARPATART